MVLYSTQLIVFSLLFSFAQSTINNARTHNSILREFLAAQPSPEIQELAKAVCKVGCLRDCLQDLQTNASKDSTARTVLEELKKTPVNVQSECRRLSPVYIFYNECERACDTGLPYKECVRQCAPDELQEGWVCHTGCRKLDTAMKNRFGDCPTTTEAIMPAEQNNHWINPPDIPSPPICTLDTDCPGDKMCCSGACMVPVFGNDIPQHVQLPQITEENSPRSFELSWNIGGENRATFEEPVLYVLQVRTYFGPEFDPMNANPWKTLTMTTIPGARLSDPDVGWWYQYRIAAVNRYGSRGFGDSTTPPVRVTSQLPQAASSPRQLVDGVWRFQADGGVHVRIEWKTPASAVIPVTEYHIQWAPDDSSSDKTTFLHIVPASQTHYLLRNLKTNMSYQILVHAISSWGTKTFTSAPATHFIITPGLPKREPFFQNRQSSERNSDRHTYGDTQVACSCDSVKTRGDSTRPQISSNFQPLRFSQPNGGVLTIRFSNAPGVSDGQFLKTILTVNEFADASDPQFLRGEKLSPRLLTIQWKQQACIETGSQLSKTFMPLKPLDESGSGSAQNENCRFVVLEPVQSTTIPAEDRLTRTGRVEISSLQLNCHYGIFVAPHKRKLNENSLQQNSEQPPIPVGCLCTPACFDDQSTPWATHFSCSKKDGEDLSPPTNLKSQLLSESELVYNVSWRPPTVIRNPRSPRQEAQPELNPEIFYRVTWGPAMDRHLNSQILRLLADPYPRLDPTESQTKVLPVTKTSFLLTSLQPNSVYVFKIQSILLKPSNHHSDEIVDVHSEIIKSSGEDYLYLQTPTRAISVNALIQDAFMNAAAGSRLHRDSMLILTIIMCIVLYR
nr:anosmin 1 [Hymenolepis microstoma]